MQRARGRKFGQIAVYGKAAGGGGSTTPNITDTSSQHSAFSTLPAFNMNVGSYNATTDDLVLFTGDEQAIASANGITVGGVSATKIEANVTDSKTVIWVIPRGSGVTVGAGVVSVAPAGSGYGNFEANIGYVHGNASSTPTSHATTAFTFFISGGVIINSCVVPSGGAGIAFWWGGSGTPVLPGIWAGATRAAASESSQATSNASACSGATQGTPGTYNINETANNAGSMAFVAFA